MDTNIIRALFDYLRYIGDGQEQNSPSLLSEELEFLTFSLNRLQSSNSQMAQDLWVLFKTNSKKNGYFIECGGGNGKDFSNTYMLEKYFGWTGVIAEANPFFHDDLKKNRNCFVSTKCLSHVSGSLISFNQTINPYLSTMTSYSNVDFHSAEREGGHLIDIETINLEDLLVQAGAPKSIDYLSLDTEGSEYDILSSFNFAKYDIHLITVEHNNNKRDDLFYLLTSLGYRRKFSSYTFEDDWYLKLE